MWPVSSSSRKCLRSVLGAMPITTAMSASGTPQPAIASTIWRWDWVGSKEGRPPTRVEVSLSGIGICPKPRAPFYRAAKTPPLRFSARYFLRVAARLARDPRNPPGLEPPPRLPAHSNSHGLGAREYRSDGAEAFRYISAGRPVSLPKDERRMVSTRLRDDGVMPSSAAN